MFFIIAVTENAESSQLAYPRCFPHLRFYALPFLSLSFSSPTHACSTSTHSDTLKKKKKPSYWLAIYSRPDPSLSWAKVSGKEPFNPNPHSQIKWGPRCRHLLRNYTGWLCFTGLIDDSMKGRDTSLFKLFSNFVNVDIGYWRVNKVYVVRAISMQRG